ncbi:MAG TPA: hypothetical protein VGA17_11520 [Nitrospiraceae bacterium]
MSKIRRIGNVLNGSEVETDADRVAAVRAWALDALYEVIAEQRAACKLCNDFGYVYLVDEDPNDPNGTIKTQRDCWECGAETN